MEQSPYQVRYGYKYLIILGLVLSVASIVILYESISLFISSPLMEGMANKIANLETEFSKMNDNISSNKEIIDKLNTNIEILNSKLRRIEAIDIERTLLILDDIIDKSEGNLVKNALLAKSALKEIVKEIFNEISDLETKVNNVNRLTLTKKQGIITSLELMDIERTLLILDDIIDKKSEETLIKNALLAKTTLNEVLKELIHQIEKEESNSKDN